MGYTMWLGQSQKKGEDHIAEKGKGTWCRKGKGKLGGEGGGGAEETYGQNPHCSPARPKGSSPQGMSEAITKSQLHSPFREQRDLVIAIRDPKNREVCENPLFLWAHKGISGSGVFANFNSPGLLFGHSKFPDHHHPYGDGNPLRNLVQKSLLFGCHPRGAVVFEACVSVGWIFHRTVLVFCSPIVACVAPPLWARRPP